MKYGLFILLLIFQVSSIFSQVSIKLEKDKLLERSNKSLIKLHILDNTLIDVNSNTQIGVNANGSFVYDDSTPVNSITYIYLTKSKEESSVYGWICGKIINGKKEGEWIKRIYTQKGKTVIVQKMNYKDGLIDGDYFAYHINGKVLHIKYSGDKDLSLRYISNGKIIDENEYLKSIENNPTQTFTNGTGLYLDYYYDTGNLKVRGELKNGVKIGQWYVFDPEGKTLRIDTYHDGISILN